MKGRRPSKYTIDTIGKRLVFDDATMGDSGGGDEDGGEDGGSSNKKQTNQNQRLSMMAKQSVIRMPQRVMGK